MKHYADRFHMTPEQSLFLAKKKWDENVYCGMRMENRNITFPQTKTICAQCAAGRHSGRAEYAGCLAVPAGKHP